MTVSRGSPKVTTPRPSGARTSAVEVGPLGGAGGLRERVTGGGVDHGEAGTGSAAGVMVVVASPSNPGQGSPAGEPRSTWSGGGLSGLPQLQRTRGTPAPSTSTAVPACSTAGKDVARPSRKPWLVTSVSVVR